MLFSSSLIRSSTIVCTTLLLISCAAAQDAPTRSEPAAAAPGGQDETEGPSVTIYSTADPASFDPQQFIAQQRMGGNPWAAWQVPGFGVVKDIRTLDIAAGTSELRFTDVAAFIDPTTVSFLDLTDPDGTAVLEQNFQFDLVSPDKLYEKYIDREVELRTIKDGNESVVTGTVLSVNGGMFILQTPEGMQFVRQTSDELRLPPLPANDLVTKPTLVWLVNAATGGEHQVRTAYQTNGLTWRSDYNLILNEDDTRADLGAWVTLMNLSGASYENARLKLIAGDVQRIQPQQPYADMRYRSAAGPAGSMEKLGFEEKSFFEYHLYTLPRRTDVMQNTTQQLTLFPTATDATVEKVLVYEGAAVGQVYYGGGPQQGREYGATGNTKVDVYIRFENKETNQLGMPLPGGKVRVYKRDDADGTLEFIGEDLIDHTPRNEKVLIRIGQSFDVVGERTQTDFTVDSRAHIITESFKIQIRNQKDVAQKVIIREPMYRWSQWEITKHTEEFEKVNARAIEFTIDVPAEGEQTIEYTVKYTW